MALTALRKWAGLASLACFSLSGLFRASIPDHPNDLAIPRQTAHLTTISPLSRATIPWKVLTIRPWRGSNVQIHREALMSNRNSSVLLLVAVLSASSWLETTAMAQPPPPRVVDITAADGVNLKATYFSAGKPGPGVLLLHQCNRQRKVWDDLAERLAASGLNVLTFDFRGFGESGGTPIDKLTPEQAPQVFQQKFPADVDTAFRVSAGGDSQRHRCWRSKLWRQPVRATGTPPRGSESIGFALRGNRSRGPPVPSRVSQTAALHGCGRR